MRAVPIKDHTPEWHVWRSQGIGGSDAPIIAVDAGLCAPASWMKSVQHLWELKTGRRADSVFDNAAMRKGRLAEPLVRKEFIRQSGVDLQPMYGEMDEFNFVHASFDGVDYDRRLVVEIKCSGKAHALAQQGKIIDYYLPQVVHQGLTLWGMPEAWTAENRMVLVTCDPDGFIGDGLPISIVDKSAMEFRSYAESLLEAEKKFWSDVQNSSLPCGPEWAAAAAAFLLVKAKKDELDEEEEIAKANLLSLLGNQQKMSGAGVSVARQSRQGAVDYSKVLKDIPGTAVAKLGITPEQAALIAPTPAELELYRKKGSESIVYRALAGGEEKEAANA